MPRPWTVLSHTPLEKLQPNLWSVDSAHGGHRDAGKEERFAAPRRVFSGLEKK